MDQQFNTSFHPSTPRFIHSWIHEFIHRFIRSDSTNCAFVLQKCIQILVHQISCQGLNVACHSNISKHTQAWTKALWQISSLMETQSTRAGADLMPAKTQILPRCAEEPNINRADEQHSCGTRYSQTSPTCGAHLSLDFIPEVFNKRDIKRYSSALFLRGPGRCVWLICGLHRDASQFPPSPAISQLGSAPGDVICSGWPCCPLRSPLKNAYWTETWTVCPEAWWENQIGVYLEL